MPDLRQPPNITGQRMITNARPVKLYVYRGDGTDQLQDEYLQKRTEPKERAECGTKSGYKRHRNLGEEACRRCKDANSKYQREWEAAKRKGRK